MNKRILIVDDESVTLKVLDKLLKNAGYETRTASSGNEALQMMRANPPHLLVLDLVLPDIDGITASW